MSKTWAGYSPLKTLHINLIPKTWVRCYQSQVTSPNKSHLIYAYWFIVHMREHLWSDKILTKVTGSKTMSKWKFSGNNQNLWTNFSNYHLLSHSQLLRPQATLTFHYVLFHLLWRLLIPNKERPLRSLIQAPQDMKNYLLYNVFPYMLVILRWFVHLIWKCSKLPQKKKL